MQDEEFYAHTLDGCGSESWQPLFMHLENVAYLAASFAGQFGCAPWGYAVGMLHDGGKAGDDFQRRLFDEHAPSFDHAILGASIALATYRSPTTVSGQLMAYVIAGHHGGLPNGRGKDDQEHRRSLQMRLSQASQSADEANYELYLQSAHLSLPDAQELGAPPFMERLLNQTPDPDRLKQLSFAAPFFARMLYSCLVDADYLDTEAFVTPEAARARMATPSDFLESLCAKLDAHMDDLQAGAVPSPVNTMRAHVLECCREQAQQAPGLFSLTVPTGGGKTLASLAFALRHAVAHGKQRVIYAIPFTSIVEQTAEVFRSVLGEHNVLEHHSNYDFDAVDDERRLRERLAIQNWDAPVIVTTNVQLLESLFANKPARCRKLHNVVNSVVVLDEAQTLPDELLTVSLAALEELTIGYGTSVVLCTATQPALDGRWPFGSEPREIVTRQAELREAFQDRSEFVVDGKIDEADCVKALAASHQVLCIVGTKAKARILYQDVVQACRADGSIDDEPPYNQGIFHLSTNMTPLHRATSLACIRERLKRGERCVVISTQLIEAGVDVDFPVVYRELAGIDSMIQAAGRCNREGKRSKGAVHVFEFVDESEAFGESQGKSLATAGLGRMKDLARTLIVDHDGELRSEMVTEFFECRYALAGSRGLDAKGLWKRLSSHELAQNGFDAVDFADYAHDYRIIDDDSTPVFVPWGEQGISLLHELKLRCEAGEAPAAMAAKLQRSSVGIKKWRFAEYKKAGFIDTSFDPIFVLNMEGDCEAYYSDEVGVLEPGREELHDLIC